MNFECLKWNFISIITQINNTQILLVYVTGHTE